MPKSALPEHLQDVENHFPDDDQYNNVPVFGKLYRWYQKTSKTWFCFSYRCTEWWARWRRFPKVLFAVKGTGPFRFETEEWDSVYYANHLFNEYVWAYRDLNEELGEYKEGYLSRIQYYTRWHFAVQWPLMVSFHFYPKAADVPVYGLPRPDTDGKVWYFYWNHFDADLVYWMVTSIFGGRVWK